MFISLDKQSLQGGILESLCLLAIGLLALNTQMVKMNITPDLTFLNIHNPFTNEMIREYLDKQSCMSLDTKDYFVKQISHLSKGMVIAASV